MKFLGQYEKYNFNINQIDIFKTIMKKLLKPMKNKIPQIVFIFIFLSIQVYCDLTLPQYTADIVNVGIQNTNFQFIIDIGMMMLLIVAISALATVGVQAEWLQAMQKTYEKSFIKRF